MDKIEKRIHIVYGHFGSGKSEFSINYGLYLSKYFEKVAICDLDIINMYFRVREKTALLEENSIEVYSSSRGHQDVLDVPALDPSILKPIQDKSYQAILDLGGDPKGALILRTYKQYLKNTENIFVINTNRPETSNVDDIIAYMKEIEAMAGVKTNVLINTSHMLKSTSESDVLKGHAIVNEVSEKLNIEFRYDVCQKDIAKSLKNNPKISIDIKNKLFPINLYLREDWMS
ncbi:ATP-binding protein [uncultured Anaerococcus sp.]|uniref:ATP-binding protein n=1 Tax=uncultured Anaerococcus sp. TaxID=293428 RepID=UPI002626A0AD|nr:ATP-binding protein [uncultured Anaerococcus sp.]